jgi:hypothetical protein
MHVNEGLQRQRELAIAKKNDLREQIGACERDTINYELLTDLLTSISERLLVLRQKGS